MCGLPSFINDKIQYDDPKKLEETIRCAKCFMINKGEERISKRLGNTR
jgi:hypothetical protein